MATVHPHALTITKPSQPHSVTIGDKLPTITLSYLNGNKVVQHISLSSLFKGKRVVSVGVSAPFSPPCTRFVKRLQSARDNSSNLIACVSSNHVFVMRVWGENLAVGDRVLMLSDGRGELANALGVSLNTTRNPNVGLGVRSTRFCFVTYNGVIKSVEFDEEEDTLSSLPSP